MKEWEEGMDEYLQGNFLRNSSYTYPSQVGNLEDGIQAVCHEYQMQGPSFAVLKYFLHSFCIGSCLLGPAQKTQSQETTYIDVP